MLLYLSILTIFLSLILAIYNWHINRNSVFLALLFTIVAIYGMTHYFTLYGNSSFWLAVFYNHFSSFMLLAGPLLFFYVRGTLNDQTKFNYQDILHLIPFLLHFSGNIPFYLMSFKEKMVIADVIIHNIDAIKNYRLNLFFTSAVNFILRPLLLMGYSIYCIYLIFHAEPIKKNIPKKQFMISFRWMMFLNISLLILAVSFLIITIKLYPSKASYTQINAMPVHMISGITFFFLSFSLLLFPQVLYGMPNYQNHPDQHSLKKRRKNINQLKSKTEEPVLTETENSFNELSKKINAYLIKEKPFLQPRFSISDLAQALKVPQHHVAYCFNTILKIKFSTLKNKLRVEHAKNLLQSGASVEMTIDGIGQSSGFSSRSNFYNAFKTETGYTPKEFLDNMDDALTN